MIVIKVEMWPGGREDKAEEFGRAVIANDFDRSAETPGKLGDYSASFMGGVWGRRDLARKVWRRSAVTGFSRTQRGVWDLIYLALKEAVGKRNQ